MRKSSITVPMLGIRGSKGHMMNKELAMQQRWFGILIAGCLAGCSSPAAEKSQMVPDHFDDNLDVLTRSIEHPCGSDMDNDGDGMIDLHYTYTYDALGRSMRDIGVDLTGALYEQIDYTWDNAGHLVHQHDAYPTSLTIDRSDVYDALGRETEFRQLVSDSDPNDDTSSVHDQETIDYSNFDALGHSAHGDELFEDLDAMTSQTLTREYSYDDLGRRIGLDVHFASGDLNQAWTHTYDDVAHTVTSTLHEPVTVFGHTGSDQVFVDTYDADGHWLASHTVQTDLSGAGNTVFDDRVQWDGDRELSVTSTDTSTLSTGEVLTFGSKTIYKYECNSARVATGPLRPSALSRPVHAVRGLRQRIR